jgi:hypothetical protein
MTTLGNSTTFRRERVLALARAVAETDPWCWSSEGLDDGCHFCGSDRGRRPYTNTAPPGRLQHKDRCDWLSLREALGLPALLDHVEHSWAPVALDEQLDEQEHEPAEEGDEHLPGGVPGAASQGAGEHSPDGLAH